MPSEPSSNPPPLRRWLNYRRKRFWGALLFLLYGLLGAFALPPILRAHIVEAAQRSLGRPVTLDRVRVNPLILSVDLHDLKITETDGAPLLAFSRLHVRLGIDGLWHRAWCLASVRIEGFKGNLVRYGPGDTNIGRLIQALQSGNGQPKPAKDPEGLRLLVHHLGIQDAALTFTDRVPTRPFTTEIGPVNAEIDGFSTLPDETGRQHVAIDFEKGAVLEWTSQFSLAPLSFTGHVKARGPYIPLLARYFGEAYKLSAPSGTVDADLDYHLQGGQDGALGLSVDHLNLALTDVSAQETGAAAPFLSLPQLHLAGGHLAWPQREISADSFSVDGLSLAALRQEDGSLAPMPALPASPQPDGREDAPWSISLGKAEIRHAKAQFEDRAVPGGGKIEIASLDLSAERLSNKQNAGFPFSLSAAMASGGTLKLQGKASLLPGLGLDAKLSVAGLPLAVAQPYLHALTRLSIEDGRLDSEGDVKMGGQDGLKVVGHGEITSLKLKDEVEQQPVIAWDRFGIDRYVYRQSKNELSISQASLSGPYLRFQVAQDHTTNFSHIAVPAASPKAVQATAAEPLKISVGRIEVASGSADYGDASLPLPFATHITNMAGHVSTLTSTASSASSLSLRGQVDQYGQASLYGHINPFFPTKGMKLNVVFKNVAFPGLSPYTAKFAGRRIARGNLDLESQYSVEGGKLVGSNKVVIRDMELGEKIDVPGALDLPFDLLISLLKDDEGKIDLDIPITGDVNDPHFDFGAVVTQELGDFFGNILSAPFRALAGLFGGGGQALDHIDFLAGRSDLEPPEQEKLQHIAELLQKKPGLDLVISGPVDREADRRRLQRDAIEAQMAKDLGDHDTVGRQRRYLENLFLQRLGKDKLAAVKQPFAQSGDDDPGYIAALRHEVARTMPMDDAALDRLAQARGEAVVDALKKIPGFDPGRVSLRGTRDAKADDQNHVPMKLDAARTDIKQ